MKMFRVSFAEEDYCWIDLEKIDYVEWSGHNTLGLDVIVNGRAYFIPEKFSESLLMEIEKMEINKEEC